MHLYKKNEYLIYMQDEQINQSSFEKIFKAVREK